MKIIQCEQNTPEWHEARIGVFTASNMDKIISPTGKASAQVEKYVTQMLADIVSGQAEETFSNKHMERGKTLEEEAADYYAMIRKVDLQKVGFCTSDDGIIGVSPDRFVGEDGMLEIKTCMSRIMIEQYEKQTLEQDHRPQTQCALKVATERAWIDTMLYCPNMKPIIVRSERNNAYLMDMTRLTISAHDALQRRLKALHEKGLLDEKSQKYLRA